MKTILLTGATGFIGRKLAAVLSKENYVIAVVRSENYYAKSDQMRYVVIRQPNLEELRQTISAPIDVVCHLAAALPRVHLDSSHLRSYFESNVMLTLEILKATIELGARRFIHFSTGNAYAQNTRRPAKETDSLYPSALSPYYLGSKVFAEFLVEHYRQQYGLPSLTLRLSSVYGWGMAPSSAVLSFIDHARTGRPISIHGDGSYSADLVYVQDVVDVSVAAANGGSPGIYNVGTGAATSLKELAALVCRVFESQIPIEFIPDTSSGGKGFRPLKIEKASKEWSWKPNSVVEGLTQMRKELEQGQPYKSP